MIAWKRLGAALVLAAAVAGCAAAVRSQEDQLSAAGFMVRPADTPRRQAALATLPPDRVSQQIRGNVVSYLYPDPKVCHCLYVGDQAAFARYQQALQQQRIANAQLEAAQLNSWDWGPWGGFGPGYGANFGPGFYP